MDNHIKKAVKGRGGKKAYVYRLRVLHKSHESEDRDAPPHPAFLKFLLRLSFFSLDLLSISLSLPPFFHNLSLFSSSILLSLYRSPGASFPAARMNGERGGWERDCNSGRQTQDGKNYPLSSDAAHQAGIYKFSEAHLSSWILEKREQKKPGHCGKYNFKPKRRK